MSVLVEIARSESWRWHLNELAKLVVLLAIVIGSLVVVAATAIEPGGTL